MEAAVPADLRATATKSEAWQHFLTALENQDPAATAAWLGGLNSAKAVQNLTTKELADLVRHGLKGEDLSRTWRLLTRRSVLRFQPKPIQNQTEEEDIPYLFLAPEEVLDLSKRINCVRFRLIKTDQGWRVRLPALFRVAHKHKNARVIAQSDFAPADRTLERNFFRHFKAHVPPAPPTRELEEIAQQLAEAIVNGETKTALSYLYRAKKLPELASQQQLEEAFSTLHAATRPDDHEPDDYFWDLEELDAYLQKAFWKNPGARQNKIATLDQALLGHGLHTLNQIEDYQSALLFLEPGRFVQSKGRKHQPIIIDQVTKGAHATVLIRAHDQLEKHSALFQLWFYRESENDSWRWASDRHIPYPKGPDDDTSLFSLSRERFQAAKDTSK